MRRLNVVTWTVPLVLGASVSACSGELPSDYRVKEKSPETISASQSSGADDQTAQEGSTQHQPSVAPDETTSEDVQLVDPNATPETKAVFAGLRRLAPDKTLSGMQSASTGGLFQLRDDGRVDWNAEDGVKSDVRTLCGAGPGVYGFDVAGVVGDWWRDLPEDERQKLMAKSRAQQIEHSRLIWERGGIVTLSWHAANPITNEGYRDGPRELWRIVPEEKCAEVEEAVPDLEGCGSHWDVFSPKVDILVEHFKNMKTEEGTPIPIIWRPWHENSGGWFWWGADKNADERYQVVFRAIWSWMVNHFQDEGVNNLLWAISPNGHGGWEPMDAEKYLSYGPEPTQVDIFGYDFYGTDLNRQEEPSWGSAVLDEMAMVVDLARQYDKVAAFTEGGSTRGLADEYACDFWTKSMIGPVLEDEGARGIAYFLTWTNHPTHEPSQWGPVPGHCSADDFTTLCERSDFLLEGEIDWTEQ